MQKVYYVLSFPLFHIVMGYLLSNLSLAYAEESNKKGINSNDYHFDSLLLRGNRFNIGNIDQFNSQTIEPGIHKVDLYINNVFFEEMDIKFIKSTNSEITPCFSYSLLLRLGIKADALVGFSGKEDISKATHCVFIENVLGGAKTNFTLSSLKLDLSIPQASLNKLPRGYVSPEKLNSGESMLFVNYMANQYHVGYKNSTIKDMDSTYISLNGGFNLGLWRYRQQAFFTKQSRSDEQFTTTNRYVQRAIVPLESELTIGETYTTGDYFSGIGFRGVVIKSDERMLPQSQQGYAPTISGIARTNAKVIVSQGGTVIYETTVPPGQFTINDLYSTNYAGDLDVKVQEADGTSSTFIVPFSSVPGSLRTGTHRYSLTLGKSRFVGDHNPFAEFLFRQGITNSTTLNTGLRTAENYNAGLLGGVYSSNLGAVGLDATFSNASLPMGSESGWKFRLAYSKTLEPTKTSISASSNYYSKSGFRDLNDVLGIRESFKKNSTWYSSSYNQRSRFDLSINQNLGDFGSIYLSGAIQHYYGDHKPDNQLQLSYGKVFSNGVSLNVAVNRSRFGAVTYDNNNLSLVNTINKTYGSKETTTLVSLSFPIGRSKNAPTFANSINHSNSGGTSYLSSLSGTVGESQRVNYGLNYSTDSQQHSNTWNGSLQSRLPVGTVSVSAANSREYWQGSASMQGALVLHRGGITAGPYLGDTFALLQADGAKGAKVVGGQGAAIDMFGYALVPSLSPYRYNTIALNPEGMSSRVELQNGQYQLAPYAGANVKLNFKTIKGYPILITAVRSGSTDIIPMGADVVNTKMRSIGMVGQGNQLYIRSDKMKDTLMIKWGASSNEKCQLSYDLKGQDLKQPLIMLKANCQ